MEGDIKDVPLAQGDGEDVLVLSRSSVAGLDRSRGLGGNGFGLRWSKALAPDSSPKNLTKV